MLHWTPETEVRAREQAEMNRREVLRECMIVDRLLRGLLGLLGLALAALMVAAWRRLHG